VPNQSTVSFTGFAAIVGIVQSNWLLVITNTEFTGRVNPLVADCTVPGILERSLIPDVMDQAIGAITEACLLPSWL